MANDTNELFEYPKGQFSFSPGGRLRQCVDVELTISNGAKLKHSLAQTPSGVFTGSREASARWTAEIPKKGSERDYVDAVMKGSRKQARLEIPGNGIVLELVVGSVTITATLEDSVRVSCNAVGKLVAATSL